jgi:hypothetical protein
VEHIVSTQQMRNAFIILVGKSEGGSSPVVHGELMLCKMCIRAIYRKIYILDSAGLLKS